MGAFSSCDEGLLFVAVLGGSLAAEDRLQARSPQWLGLLGWRVPAQEW